MVNHQQKNKRNANDFYHGTTITAAPPPQAAAWTTEMWIKNNTLCTQKTTANMCICVCVCLFALFTLPVRVWLCYLNFFQRCYGETHWFETHEKHFTQYRYDNDNIFNAQLLMLWQNNGNNNIFIVFVCPWPCSHIKTND